MLNSVGLQNPGADIFLRRYLPWLRQQGAVVIANVAGRTVEEYADITRRVADAGVDMVELNISCPNVAHGGAAFGTCAASVSEVVAYAKHSCGNVPLIVKLTPNVTDIAEMAEAAEAAGADALSLINTITAMRVDIHTRRPVLRNNIGGLSGPAVFPVALRMVRQVYKRVRIPIIGLGGVSTWEDAAEMMIAGAGAVQVGTAMFRDPYAPVKIIDGLAAFAAQQGLGNIAELVGTLEEWE